MTRASRIWAWMLVTLAVIGLSTANLWMGELNQDEGWYLYAATQVADGRLPYIDYSYTQAPVLPLVYAAVTPVIDSFGIAGGRFVTLLLGLSALGLAGLAASRISGQKLALLLTVILGGINVYQSYFTTIVKTYSLCGFFLAAGFYLLSRLVRSSSWWPGVFAGVCLALAAGTRISAGVAMPVVFLVLGWESIRGRRSLGPALGFAVGGGLTLIAIFVPFLILAPQSALFHLVEYHSARSAGGLVNLLVYKAGFLSRVVQAYFFAAVLLAGCVLYRCLGVRKQRIADGSTRSWLTMAVASVAGISLLHFLAPFPYDDYQVPVYPLVCAILAVVLSAWLAGMEALKRSRYESLVVWWLLLASAAAAGSSPINQNWMIAGRDRIWWLTKSQPAIVQLREAAAQIAALHPEGRLFTQDIYLAVEAGLAVPEGMEMGPFSYYPGWPDEQAAAMHVMNEAGLHQILATTDCPVAAVSDYGFSIDSPSIKPIPAKDRTRLLAQLEERYDLAETIEQFGQAGTTLRLYTLKPELARP